MSTIPNSWSHFLNHHNESRMIPQVAARIEEHFELPAGNEQCSVLTLAAESASERRALPSER